jgi:hypothetical protein
MVNRKQTSPRIAELASKILRNPKASKQNKALAGSALVQARATKPHPRVAQA